MGNIRLALFNRVWFRRLLIGLAVAFLLFFTAFFAFRNVVLRHVLAEKTETFCRRFEAELVTGKASFTGLFSLRLDSVMLKPLAGDTLLTIGRVVIEPSVWKLLTGSLSPERVIVDRFHLNLVRHDSLTNYMFLLGHRQPDTGRRDTLQAGDLARLTDRLASFIFDKLPVNTHLSGFRVMADLDGNRFVVSTPEFTLSDTGIANQVWITNNGITAPMTVNGLLKHSRKEASFCVYPADTVRIVMPYIDWKWKAAVSFDTLRFNLAFGPLTDGITTIAGQGLFAGLRINQPMVSDKTVLFNTLEGKFIYHIGSDYVELDSASVFRVNRLTVNPWIRIYPRKPLRVALRVNKPEFPAQELFGSLPEGLFTNLQGMEVNGNLSYTLRFSLDMACPDSLKFYSSLDRHGFKIIKYGATNLTMINGSFMHTAYEKGVPVRTFVVGPENPEFRSLESVSPYLRNAIMTAEDGGFMWHRGFLPDAFRGAIVDNVKAGRFVRGGSTISMQLVKNVFLNRNKTVTRKLEEALIVWLIENERLSSKERMYEVYLNIIEMGPLVYGVQEGARFYFNKDVSQLTLAESIFMASIVPHPKWFRYSFDGNGNLREFLAPYYSFLANRMVNKGFITEAEAASLQPDVKLTGPARNFITPADSLNADSLQMALPVMDASGQ